MSNTKQNKNKVGYKNPPKKTQFQPGKSGNYKGRPKKKASTPPPPFRIRVSMDTFRQIVMEGAYEIIIVSENGTKKEIFVLDGIIKQLYRKAAQGNIQAAKLILGFLENFATENDRIYHETTLSWMEIYERKVAAEIDPGSLEHFDALKAYYMAKKGFRLRDEKWSYIVGQDCGKVKLQIVRFTLCRQPHRWE